MSTTVAVAVEEGVATLTLDRPQSLNALSVEMMQQLRRSVEAVLADPSAQVIVIKGAGEHFMAGGDIGDFDAHLALDPPARLNAFRAMIEQYINPTVLALNATHRPVICSVRGACAGFGMSLMLGCDLAMAADSAYFTMAYAAIGLSPDGGGTYFLPRIVGARKAAELMLLSERIGAAQALELGLVNRVVPAAELDAETAALAQRLTRGPRHAYGEIKRLLNGSSQRSLVDQLHAEGESFSRCAATADFAAGVRAFMEKRPPRFSGT
jgi:2-(1,2-epoxy-1,2-dihydrophenyl)acetyl-CoA isomerase